MSHQPVDSLLADARALQVAGAARCATRLRGKNIGLLCAVDNADAASFRDAATALGALVSLIRPQLSALATEDEVTRTAQLLGRLYDVVDCLDVPPALVAKLGRESGIPVCECLAGQQLARLADRLDGDAPAADKRRCVLQAMLLRTLE